MMIENRKAVEALTAMFERVAEHAKEKRWPPEVVADAAFRASLSLAMAEHGIRGVAEQCRRLSVKFGQFSDAIDASG